MLHVKQNVTWTESWERGETFSVEFVLLFVVKTKTVLKCTTLVPYSAYAVFLSVLTQFRRMLILNVLTVIEFICVNCSSKEIIKEHGEHGSVQLSEFGSSLSTRVPLSNSARLTSSCKAHEKKKEDKSVGKHESASGAFIRMWKGRI